MHCKLKPDVLCMELLRKLIKIAVRKTNYKVQKLFKPLCDISSHKNIKSSIENYNEECVMMNVLVPEPSLMHSFHIPSLGCTLIVICQFCASNEHMHEKERIIFCCCLDLRFILISEVIMQRCLLVAGDLVTTFYSAATLECHAKGKKHFKPPCYINRLRADLSGFPSMLNRMPNQSQWLMALNSQVCLT